MKYFWRKIIIVIICICFMITTISSAHAANWLMLQGTEKQDASNVKIWGFLQPQYMAANGTKLKAGGWRGQAASFNLIAPDLASENQFQLRRARFGVRGKKEKLNYFFLTEFGDNGITKNGKSSAKLTDASITLNYIQGIRMRVGQFKTPGAEDGLQAIHAHNYTTFANVTNQMLLERFFDGDGADTSNPNTPNGSVSAFRDIGVEIFDAFTFGDWEGSYAFMAGNGNGIARGDNDRHKDVYGYLSSEWLFGGKGPKREGLKIFGWFQAGKRTLTQSGVGEYDRNRYGTGITFRKGRYRCFSEYVLADGMIFYGTDGGAVAGSSNNAGTSMHLST